MLYTLLCGVIEMETLIKMLNILAWIAVVVCPIFVVGTILAQKSYEGSLRKAMDAMKGYEIDYTANTLKFVAVFVIALVYLIAKYVM